MKKFRFTCFVLLFSLVLTACAGNAYIAAPASIPDDFSFAITWNTYGISSYDSQTGKLTKTTDAANPADFVTQYHLTEENKVSIYQLLNSLDINSYPDKYDPGNGASKPSMTLILTLRINGTEKTIRAEGIGQTFVSEDENGQKFLSDQICQICWVCVP